MGRGLLQKSNELLTTRNNIDLGQKFSVVELQDLTS